MTDDDTRRFTHAGREWIARRLLSEDSSRFFWRVTPARPGRPFPSRAEHREAVRVWAAENNSVTP